VIGPAGTGKSTYCSVIQKHCENVKRIVHVVNLDPAAEEFKYDVAIDVRDLISLQDVMEECNYGPNGGLIFCMEYLMENMNWLDDQIADYGDDYLIFDCPGQIELYTHLPVMPSLVRHLQKLGYQLCAVCCVDSLVMHDTTRFISGTLICLSAMIQLELPHINVLTKCDLMENKKNLEQFYDPDIPTLVASLNKSTTESMRNLNKALGNLIDEYSMVTFMPLDISNEDSIELCLSQIDNAIQFGEDQEVREEKDAEDRDDDDDQGETETHQQDHIADMS